MMQNVDNGGGKQPEGNLIQAFRAGSWNSLPEFAAVITATLGLAVLVGWMFSIPLLKSVLPGAVEMKANTALGLLLSACALFMLGRRQPGPPQRLAQILGLAVMALGLATLGEYLFGWQLGIDELLFRDTTGTYALIPGRMSPFSAVTFIMIGLALSVLPWRAMRPLVWLASITVMAIGAIAFMGYLWNASELVTDTWLPPVAVNTAIAFALLGAGMFRASWVSEQRRLFRTLIEIRILTAFIGTFMLLVLVGGYTYKKVAELENSTQLVRRTQEIRTALGQLYATISEAETSQRDYLLTGMQLYKEKFRRLAAEADDDQRKLARLIGDDPAQKKNFAELEPLIVHRMDLLEKFLSQFERQGLAVASDAISRSDAVQTMDSIRDLAGRLDSAQMALLSEREATLNHNRELTLVALLATLALSACIFIALFLGIHREIIGRSRAEQQLRDSAVRIQAILNTVADGIITINECGIVETVNPAAARLFGYAAEEIAGQNVSMLMPDSDRSQHDGYIKRYCATGQARVIGIGREVTGRRKDGSTFPVYLAISEMRLDSQRYFTGIVHDLTERKQTEQSLVAAREQAVLANRAKDSFLATMSHEIRTPLTGMLGMLEMLSLTPHDPEQNETLQAAWDSGRSLLRIVSDILDWSKIEEGKLALVPRSTSIPQLLQEVVNTYSRVASAKSLILSQHVDPRLSPAHIVDALRLSQVLNNFVSNAIKFTARGDVELRAELLEQIESGERIRFSVRDTGVGIAREAQQHLFQRYRQESDDTARMYGGTGLGLAICRRLVDMMDGQIELESEPGQGATFSITLVLPVSGATEEMVQNLHLEVAQRAVTPLLVGGADAPLVLTVDDHPINRDLLARQIRLLGLRAETAENGQAALSKWRGGRFALVITDCHMPEMDGYALSRAIRKIEAEERLVRIPIIAWTANALAGEEENCRNAGMDDLLVKPAPLLQLKKMLAKNLSIAPAAPSQPGTSQGQEPIDYTVLGQVVPDGAEQFQVLHDFQSHIRADRAKLLEALEQGDPANIERTAHRMKGSCRMVGAMHLAKACADIEQAAHDDDIALARAARLALDEAFLRLEAYLAEMGNTEQRHRGESNED
jgi:PAS domain S-box-containing protein